MIQFSTFFKNVSDFDAIEQPVISKDIRFLKIGLREISDKLHDKST